jgi:hypothetical protein
MAALWGRAVILWGAAAVAATTLSGCVSSQPDVAHLPVVLRAPYDQLPPAPQGATVHAGAPVALTALQQEAVVSGVMPFMKDTSSVRFGNLRAARNGQGIVTVCGDVDGRNGAGRHTGFSPFIGVLPAPQPAAVATRRRDTVPTVPAFVLVEIGGTAKDRAVVEGLCRESGII